MSREWDAATYDRVANPHVKWGSGILEHLDTDGVATVVDAGCGTGRVTELVLDRVPAAHVVAIDGSQKMVDEANRRLAAAIAEQRVTVLEADRAPFVHAVASRLPKLELDYVRLNIVARRG